MVQRLAFEKVYENFSCPPWESKSIDISTIIALEKTVTKQSGKTLDIGCGHGKTLDFLAKNVSQTYGIDISYVAIKFAKNTYNLSNLVVGDVMRLPFKDSSFGLVVDIGLLHCINPSRRHVFGGEIKRVLKEKGSYLISAFLRDKDTNYEKPIFYAFVKKRGKTYNKIPGHSQIPTWGFTLDDIELLFGKGFLVVKHFYYGDRIIVLMKKR